MSARKLRPNFCLSIRSRFCPWKMNTHASVSVVSGVKMTRVNGVWPVEAVNQRAPAESGQEHTCGTGDKLGFTLSHDDVM